MAFTNTDAWIAQHSYLLSRKNIVSLTDAVNADIKEARPTVRRKPPLAPCPDSDVCNQGPCYRDPKKC